MVILNQGNAAAWGAMRSLYDAMGFNAILAMFGVQTPT